MTAQIGNTDNDERGLLPLPGNHSRNKGRPGSYEHCREALRQLHSVPVYAEAPRRARQYLLGHRRGHTRPLAVKTYAGCPYIHSLSK